MSVIEYIGTFPKMVTVLPQTELGKAKIDHFEITKNTWVGFDRDAPRPGKYARLYVGGCLMMTDTDMERQSNNEFYRKAKGHVLIAGMGLGMILLPTLAKESVESVTVVEKYQDVIDVVHPHIQNPKLACICADIFDWKPVKGQKFDTIYFDIWPDMCTDYIDEMSTLHRRFARSLNRANNNCWMGSWQQDYLKSRRRQERENDRRYRW